MNANSNPIAPPVVTTVLDDVFPNRIAIELRTDDDPESGLSSVDILLFDDELEDDYSLFTIANNPSKLRHMAAWMLEAAAWMEKNANG